MVVPEPRTLVIPMRDGVELVGDLYLPRPDGAFPTLVCKSPYERKRPARYAEISAFLDHGYAVVIVSFRGRWGSGGAFNEWATEGWATHQDGYDTVEWCAEQTWSTGDIGTFGISADGQWQLTTAPTQPPHLKAMCTSYAADGRTCVENGMFTATFPRWHAMNDVFAVDLGSREDWDGWLGRWRDTKTPLLTSFIHPGLLDSMAGVADEEYWASFDPAARYADFDVPVLYECGWYDRYTAVQIRHFLAVDAVGGNNARGNQKLVCGPWVHGGNLPAQNEDVRFPRAAYSDRVEMQVRWFDHWLKGEDTGIMDERVSVYVGGGGDRWLHSTTWPPPESAAQAFHLAATGPATPGASVHDGALVSADPAADEPSISFTHDPHDPVPTVGGHGGVGWMWPAGPLDQADAEARSVTYTTDELDAPLEVVGDPVVELHLSSTAVDTDVVVTLADVHPSGYSEIIIQSAMRARYRNGPGQTDLLEPGEVYPMRLQLSAVAHRFLPGHRVRIGVASSSFPNFLPNAGTAEPPFMATNGVVATNTLHHDAAHRSRLVLPVRPLEA